MELLSGHNTVISAAPSSSCFLFAAAWIHSHRIQSFTNCCSMGPSYVLQFFKICSSMGPFYRVLSLKKRLLQQRLQLLPGGFSCIGCLWACRANPQENGTISSPSSPTWTARKSLLWHLDHLFPFLILWTWCLQGCFSQIFLTPFSQSYCAVFFILSSASFFHRGTSSVADWLNFGQQCVCCRASLHWLCHMGQPLAISNRGHHCIAPLPTPCLRNPNTR